MAIGLTKGIATVNRFVDNYEFLASVTAKWTQIFFVLTFGSRFRTN